VVIAELTLQESTLLEHCETRIERGIGVFLEVGDALLVIRDSRLYRASHPTFEAYCQDKWNIERRRAYQLISAAQVVRNVQDSLSVNRGTHSVTERVLRPLTGLDPTVQRTAWQQVVQENPDGPITGATVQEVVDRMMGDDEEDEGECDDDDYIAYEREVLLPSLHDAGLDDAPQILSGQHAYLPPIPIERQEEARDSLRQSVIDILALCRQGHTLDECADEILDVMGQGSNSIALAARFGIALSEGPKTLADLTVMAIRICGGTTRGMDRDDYLRWRKRVLRLVDSLTYSGCGIFEHKLQNGQLLYGLDERKLKEA